MSSFGELVKNSVWHAFKALDEGTEGKVSKSRLVVLTASLGNLLGHPNIEKGIQDYRSTPYLKYEDYIFYLEKELFAFFPNEVFGHFLNKIRHDIDDVCWVVYKQKVCVSAKNYLPGYCYFYLFRIFCELSNLTESDEGKSVMLHASELQFLVEMFNDIFGLTLETSVNGPLNLNLVSVTFNEFIAFMETNFIRCLEENAFVEATDEVYKVIVENVIKKGYLKKFLTPVGPCWELYFVLKQYSLSWGSSKTKMKSANDIEFQNSNVELKDASGCQILLQVDNKIMALNAPDNATKLQWVAALKTALKHSKSSQPYQRYRAELRKEARLELEKKREEQELILLQREEALELQKRDKMQLELELQKEMEKQKDFELREKILLTQLEEERQAKRDEEIVRNLQSRLLAEEWERREVLEQEKTEQEEQLQKERRIRLELEQQQSETKSEIEQMENVVSTLKRQKEYLSGTLKRTPLLSNEGNSKDSENKNETRMKRSLSADFSLVKNNIWTVTPCNQEEDEMC